MDPRGLEFEITETVAMQSPGRAKHVLTELKDKGITIAIDDFGAGYSSLSYLKMFPIDYLKIDKSFVEGVTEDPNDAAITKTIIAMAKNLKFKVIAEGIERHEQCAFLKAHRCEEGQRYLFSEPLDAEDLKTLLSHSRLCTCRLSAGLHKAHSFQITTATI